MNESGIATPTILFINAEAGIKAQLEAVLEQNGCRLHSVSNAGEAIHYLKNRPAPELILFDPNIWGIAIIQSCRLIYPAQRIIVLSDISNMQTVAEAIKLGALDYVVKPFESHQVKAVLKRCLPTRCAQVVEDQPSRMSPASGEEHLEVLGNDLSFLAASPAMRTLRSQIQLIARVDVPVLILGESGVGKEVIANLIHKLSKRGERSLVKVNCAALPADLLESELFGYERGAFTGAVQSKPGKFELCHKGTILMDEIGELDRSLQAKLLHVLQDGQFSRLGGRSNITADFRALAATNVDIHTAVRTGRFREDLYYRLNAFTIQVPPLRERREEIPPLIGHFIKKHSKRLGGTALDYSQELLEACTRYHWPGNLRELENFVKRHLILRDEKLAISELANVARVVVFPAGSNKRPSREDLKSLVQDVKTRVESTAIREVLVATNGNRRLAAKSLNISYKALLYKIKRYGNSLPSAAELIDASPEASEQPKKRTTAAG